MVKNQFQKKAVNRLIEAADETYFVFAENVVLRLLRAYGREDAHEHLAEMYLWYTKTIRVEEMFYAKEGRYRYSDYGKVYENVYGRDEYMKDYVVGLGMTQIFWPNHYSIMRYFIDNFIPRVKGFTTGAEIGVGHGLFHSELLKGAQEMTTTMLDVSASSLDMTRRMIAATGLDPDRATPVRVDVQKEIPLAEGSVQALLLGEIIEHIQFGEELMSAMIAKMAPGGLCFFTTAANAPAEDHILLFKNTGEIRDFIARTGWMVLDEQLGTIGGMSIEKAEKGGHNINYAAVIAAR